MVIEADKRSAEFIYNDANRMSQVKQAGAVAMNYAYNGRGEQVRKHLGTNNTYTLYDEAGHWLGDYDSNGAPLQQALWLDDLPVGLLANDNQLHYIEPDHLGTPRVVIEVARDVPVWAWDVKGEAFGNTAPDQNPDGDANTFVFDMRFPGQRFDAASSLNQNGFRDYDTSGGRYVESDPIGFEGGISTYAYTYSQPTMMIDPLGLQSAATAGTSYIPPGLVGGAGAYNPNDPNNVGPNLPGQFTGGGGQKISLTSAANSLLLQSQLLMLINTVAAVSDACDTKDDDCAELLRRIEIAKNGIARRFRQLAENAGKIDQAAHWSQLRGRQVICESFLMKQPRKAA